MTHLLRPDRAELYSEVKDTFDRYIRELRADRSWEAGAYRDDPAHARRPTSFLVWEPEVYTGTESYADNRDVMASGWGRNITYSSLLQILMKENLLQHGTDAASGRLAGHTSNVSAGSCEAPS